MAVQAMVFEESSSQKQTPSEETSVADKVKQLSQSQALVKLKESTLFRIQTLGYEVQDISEGQMTAWRLSNAYQQVQIHTLEELIHFSQTQVSAQVQVMPINNNALEIAIMFGILGTCALASYFITLA
jgi:hypothetical protein